MATANDYNRIMHKAWQDVPNEQLFNVWESHAASYCKAMWKKATGRKLTAKIRFGTGNRYTWIRRGVLTVNPSAGWKEINHDFTHCIERRTTGDAHSDKHLERERYGAEMIRKRFLMEGPQPEKPKPTTLDLQQKRAASVETRIVTWERKAKRAQTALSKLRKQKRYYEKTLSA